MSDELKRIKIIILNHTDKINMKISLKNKKHFRVFLLLSIKTFFWKIYRIETLDLFFFSKSENQMFLSHNFERSFCTLWSLEADIIFKCSSKSCLTKCTNINKILTQALVDLFLHPITPIIHKSSTYLIMATINME